MAYSPKNWWTELALFASVTALSTAALFGILVMTPHEDGQQLNVLLLIIPGIVIGLLAARVYRRRHASDSPH
ncbi:hypothetical protein [Streptomyces sp. NPDC055632]